MSSGVGVGGGRRMHTPHRHLLYCQTPPQLCVSVCVCVCVCETCTPCNVCIAVLLFSSGVILAFN